MAGRPAHGVPDLRAKAQLELKQRGVSGESPYARYRFDPMSYIQDVLGWTPWRGTPDRPGQAEVVDAYAHLLRQLHEREAWERDELAEEDLEVWRPGETIKNRIRIQAGYNVGKTCLAAGLVSHYFDTCVPSIVYTFAPNYNQINDLLWKEIRVHRGNKRLPGRVLDRPEIRYRPNHFVKGRAASADSDSATERIQGQHGRYLMFVLDEAEGVADFVWDAIDSMASGGVAVVIMLANPRTRSSRFHRQRVRSDVQNFTISCLHHPNVRGGRESISGSVRREYVQTMLDEHCTIVEEHDPDMYTFEAPWLPGTILQPNAEFMWRVMGMPPRDSSEFTLIPSSRFEAAIDRGSGMNLPYPKSDFLYVGIDCARFGSDWGTIYAHYGSVVWCHARLNLADTNQYAESVKTLLEEVYSWGTVRHVQIRVDAGGGFGGGVVDRLMQDELGLPVFEISEVFEVNFVAVPIEHWIYKDTITELHGAVAEELKILAIVNPSELLEEDLTMRTYRYVTRAKHQVKQLESKDDFRSPRRLGRSPDDGDGFVLAAAPLYVFSAGMEFAIGV